MSTHTPQTTRRWVMIALFLALTTVATMALVIPIPTGGFVNLGDAVVLLGAFTLGPVGGALAAGFGSALADILLGYSIYAPATLVIKALMAVCAALIARRAHTGLYIAGAVAAECIMLVGYALYEGLLAGNLLAGLSSIGASVTQGLFGATAGVFLVLALAKVPSVRKSFPRLQPSTK